MSRSRKCVYFYIFVVNLVVISIAAFIIKKHYEEFGDGKKAAALKGDQGSTTANPGKNTDDLNTTNNTGKTNHSRNTNNNLPTSYQMVQNQPSDTLISVSSVGENFTSSTKFTTRLNSSEKVHSSTRNKAQNLIPKSQLTSNLLSNSSNLFSTISVSKDCVPSVPNAADLNVTSRSRCSQKTLQVTDSEKKTELFKEHPLVSATISKFDPSSTNEPFAINVQKKSISEFENGNSLYTPSNEIPQIPQFNFSVDIKSPQKESDSDSYNRTVQINNTSTRGISEPHKTEPLETDFYSTERNTIGSSFLNFSADSVQVQPLKNLYEQSKINNTSTRGISEPHKTDSHFLATEIKEEPLETDFYSTSRNTTERNTIGSSFLNFRADSVLQPLKNLHEQSEINNILSIRTSPNQGLNPKIEEHDPPHPQSDSNTISPLLVNNLIANFITEEHNATHSKSDFNTDGPYWVYELNIPSHSVSRGHSTPANSTHGSQTHVSSSPSTPNSIDNVPKTNSPTAIDHSAKINSIGISSPSSSSDAHYLKQSNHTSIFSSTEGTTNVTNNATLQATHTNNVPTSTPDAKNIEASDVTESDDQEPNSEDVEYEEGNQQGKAGWG